MNPMVAVTERFRPVSVRYSPRCQVAKMVEPIIALVLPTYPTHSHTLPNGALVHMQTIHWPRSLTNECAFCINGEHYPLTRL